MCERCAELEAQIQYLRGELGLIITAGEIGALRQTYGLSPNEAWLVLTLHKSASRPLSSYFLLENMPAVKVANGLDRYAKVLNVMVCRIRAALGATSITTMYGQGYAAGPTLAAKIEAAMPARAA